MKKVSFLGLPSCSWCKALREELDKEGVSYELINVTGTNELADQVEDLLGTENYPIVIVEDSNTTYYVFRAEHIYEAGEVKLSNGSIKLGAISLKGIVDGIINYINK